MSCSPYCICLPRAFPDIKNRPLSKKRPPDAASFSIKVLPFQSQAGICRRKSGYTVIDAGDTGKLPSVTPFYSPCKHTGFAHADSIPQPCPICKSLPRFLRKIRQNLGQSGGAAEGRRGDDGTSEADSPAPHRESRREKQKKDIHTDILLRIGVTGLEPAASWSRTKHSTKLSHTPTNDSIIPRQSLFVKGIYKVFLETCGNFIPLPIPAGRTGYAACGAEKNPTP